MAVALFTFGSLALAGGSLTPARAYTALALFSLLRLPMAVLPVLATTTANALVALRRIQGFLLRDEAAPVQVRVRVCVMGCGLGRECERSWCALDCIQGFLLRDETAPVKVRLASHPCA